uniref:Exocyst complex component Sec3 coiled-coil domain-containing protein n=1 Tax=Rhizophagus irregularis (strain DAOM 181602 / DAOM 197198 / MUCL 43194) TaxID=747089 RepID=U9T4Q1_RHIID
MDILYFLKDREVSGADFLELKHEIKDRINRKYGQLSSAKGYRLRTFNEKVKQLENQVHTLTNRISQLENKSKHYESKFSTIENQVNNIETSVNNINTKQDKYDEILQKLTDNISKLGDTINIKEKHIKQSKRSSPYDKTSYEQAKKKHYTRSSIKSSSSRASADDSDNFPQTEDDTIMHQDLTELTDNAVADGIIEPDSDYTQNEDAGSTSTFSYSIFGLGSRK